jgi:hypothetical protein
VIWKSHTKAWITRQIFRDSFVAYFLPEIKKNEEEYLDFRILLISDNVSAHVLDYVGFSENVKLIYMPQRCHQ